MLSLFYSVVDEVVIEGLHDWIDRGFTIADSIVIHYGLPQDFLLGEALRLFNLWNDVVHTLSFATAFPGPQRVMVICFRHPAFALKLIRVVNRTFIRGRLLDVQWIGRRPDDPTLPPWLADLRRGRPSRQSTFFLLITVLAYWPYVVNRHPEPSSYRQLVEGEAEIFLPRRFFSCCLRVFCPFDLLFLVVCAVPSDPSSQGSLRVPPSLFRLILPDPPSACRLLLPFSPPALQLYADSGFTTDDDRTPTRA